MPELRAGAFHFAEPRKLPSPKLPSEMDKSL